MMKFPTVALAVLVTLAAAHPRKPPDVTLTANPVSIEAGQSATLTWASTRAQLCIANFPIPETSGSVVVVPAATTLYWVTCTDSRDTSATASTTVAVRVQPPPPPPPPPPPLPGVAIGQFGAVPQHWWGGQLYPDGLAPFEAWLNRPIDYTVVFGGHDNGWADYEGSIAYLLGDLWAGDYSRKLIYSIPLFPKQWDNAAQTSLTIANLRDAGLGAYDQHYRTVATMIRDWREHDAEALIRVGWEFNGDWYPWASAGKEEDYKAAFRRLVSVFRSVAPNLRFVWNPNIGKIQTDPELSYPGDDVVDYVALDLYEHTEWDAGTPDQRWQSFLTRDNRGLDWLALFAKAHGKPIVIPEYATNYDVPNTVFVKNMHDWMLNNNVAIQAYWNSDSAFRGSFASHPQNGEQYRQLWGAP